MDTNDHKKWEGRIQEFGGRAGGRIVEGGFPTAVVGIKEGIRKCGIVGILVYFCVAGVRRRGG